MKKLIAVAIVVVGICSWKLACADEQCSAVSSQLECEQAYSECLLNCIHGGIAVNMCTINCASERVTCQLRDASLESPSPTEIDHPAVKASDCNGRACMPLVEHYTGW